MMPKAGVATAIGLETGSAGLGSLPLQQPPSLGFRPRGERGDRSGPSRGPVPLLGHKVARFRDALDASGSLQLGIVLAAVWWACVLVASVPYGQPFGSGGDAISYWTASLADPYANAEWNQPAAYVYSPAFLQLIAPLSLLPWPAFVGVWTALLLACVGWLCGPRWFAVGVLVAAMEVYGGNISLLLAVAIVLGFRWPAAWAFVLLTKVTPGIGLLWFALRRQWRQLFVALAATGAIVLLSAALLPGPWLEWPAVLVRNAGRTGTWAALPIPLLVRLPAAVALLVWGARRDAQWTVPVASMLALPALWYGGFSMLLAVLALTSRTEQETALARLAGSAGRLAAALGVGWTRLAGQGARAQGARAQGARAQGAGEEDGGP